MAVGNNISFKELAKRKTIDPVVNLLTGLQQGYTKNTQQEPTGTIQQLGRFAGGLTRGGSDVTGKLAEFATRPETLEVASRIGQLATAYEDPQISNVLGQIAGDIGAKRALKEEREATLAKAKSDLEKEDNKARGTYAREGFREPIEGDDERFIQEVILPSGAKETYFNQTAAVEAGKLDLEGQPKAPKDYIPLTTDIEESYTDVKDDPAFKQSGAVSGNFVNPEKLQKVVQQKEIDTEDLLSTQSNTKLINEDIKRIIDDPNLDDLVGKQNILGFNVSKRFLSGLTGLPEEIENLISSTDVISSGKILRTLLDLKKKGGGSTGFGALNQSELKVISDSIATLNTTQSKEQFIRSLEKIDKVFSDSTVRLQKAYGKKYNTEGMEMYQSPYDVNYAEKFLSQQQPTPTTPTTPTLNQMIYGKAPKQITQQKIKENVPAQGDSNVMQVGRFVMEVD